MSAEAAHPASTAEPAVPEVPARRRGRPRIDLRRLGRAALLGATAGPAPRDRLPDAIGHVAEAHRAHHPEADLSVLRRAYVLAESSHRGQFRKSGEPYITHPLAVTLILAELGAETTTLTASLLHDTVEDTEVTLDQVRREFGEEVARLVDGVTKVEKIDYGAAAEPETFRKMLLATGDDVRVMSIKLADRLHNMRTLGVMRPEKQVRIAKVTRDVLIPLAERLGVQALKTELEDLVFAILHPEEYETTRALVAGAPGADEALGAVAEQVTAVLRDSGIGAEVHVRPRHFVSVHRVRLKRGELRGCDFGRLLVLVAEDADCYGVLGELHTCFTPVISEFKDFIAVPKFNLYQSLHTAIAAPDGAVAEVLIRTHRMHRVAEAGVIALGNPYPGRDAGGQAGPETPAPPRNQAARTAPDPAAGPGHGPAAREGREPDVHDGRDPDARPGDGSAAPDGPRPAASDGRRPAARDGRDGRGKGSRSPRDPAARAPQDQDARPGRDRTAQDRPGRDRTARDRTARLAEDGERVDPTLPGWLSRLLAWQQSAPDPDTFWTSLRADLAEDDEITVFRADGGAPGTLSLPAGASCIDAAYAQHGETAHACLGARVNGRLAPLCTVLGDGDTVQLILAQDAVSGPSPEWLDHARTPAARIAITGWLRDHPESTPPPAAVPGHRPPAGTFAARRSGADLHADLEGEQATAVRPAGCCTPVPPDKITGFRVSGGSVSVHRAGCAAVTTMRGLGRDPVPVRWGDTAHGRVTLVAESFGRPGLLADLTEAIAVAGAAVVAATVEPPSEQRVRHTYTLHLPDAARLSALMRAMKDVPGVYDVSRTRHRPPPAPRRA
ncbi:MULTISPECIES: HD domain-containing protein [unclassified Streptomyces]|uniref:HD domain-containing protein n=1 Tax=unclassified Streptomyces TaxID=2593676 RepID=UPI0016614FA4|nr:MULTISPECIES: HD domain-containing protein [unclassified Streptomyces]MBD0707714.1 bifunctional (p)ppGpp synthetase/guanosine-3',5'-bis(diphosphate) 3'-pyrophosphohydrolase [Streptomyces sp. CBMA291]MBD0714951.1 bifunctional (p)ppGpp synthetase/guanosine-3',5'-bis(diphosphate) 3'-pyrophosphohydrolase [Streptomyces sp. CBMA370]